VPVYSACTSGWRTASPRPLAATGVKALNNLLALKPERVVPGHFLGTAPKNAEAVTFTRDYVQRFEQELARINTRPAD
jgi:glyoxylase-like metal-dependent hydrolase (beta-lactamase superfamily II)